MKVDEVREIKERIYEHTKNFTFEELRNYYAKSTDKAEKLIAEIRQKKRLNIKINE